jgi:hypothetical protein
VDPVSSGVLAELIADAVSSMAGRAWRRLRRTPEERTVKAAIGAAVGQALRVSALPPAQTLDEAWVAEMVRAWRPAFTRSRP